MEKGFWKWFFTHKLEDGTSMYVPPILFGIGFSIPLIIVFFVFG